MAIRWFAWMSFTLFVWCTGMAGAETAIAELDVGVTVEATVSVRATTQIYFGSVAMGAENTDAQGEILVTVSPNSIYKIGLGGGMHSNGGVRHLGGGNVFIPYHLYRDAARTTPWGDRGISGGTFSVAEPTDKIMGTGKPQAFPVYARLPKAPEQEGTFSDVVQIIIEW